MTTKETTVTSASEITQKRHERNAYLFSLMRLHPSNIMYRQALIEENLPLVSSVLARFKPYTDDKYQTGCLGLIRAVDTFDESKGVPFASFAWFCINREIHMEFKKEKDSFEMKMAEYLFNLDAVIKDANGEETSLSDLLADPNAEAQFGQLLDDFQLSWIFTEIIDPAIERACGGNSSKIDKEKWAQLERMYLLEMSEVSSQKLRINLTAIAKELSISIQYAKNKHKDVITHAQTLYMTKRGGNFE